MAYTGQMNEAGYRMYGFTQNPDGTWQPPANASFTPEGGWKLGAPAIETPSYDIFTTTKAPSTYNSPNIGIADPLLSPTSILGNLSTSKPSTELVRDIINPQLPFIEKSVKEAVNVARANAISDAIRTGGIGGSTLEGRITREIPEMGLKTLADAETKLMMEALPIAQQEKALGLQEAQTKISLRSVISDENYKKLSLAQQERLAQEDRDLKIKLDQIDKEFQAKLKQAEMDFTSAQNDIDRAAASAQLDYVKGEREKA